MLKENLKDQLDDGLEKAKRWKLLWFTKDGRSGFGHNQYDNEQAAISGGELTRKEHEEEPKTIFDSINGLEAKGEDWSHFIPMPIAE